MKLFYHIIYLTLFLSVLWPVKAQKRGIAYGYHSPQDMQMLSPNISWWYNWAVVPESAVANDFSDYGFDFVPMTWNGSFDENQLRSFLNTHPETKYLLAFNEPNFIDQANMTPSEVAAQWPRLESIANDFNLEIVGPAVNFCGNCVQENGITYTDPVKYLDDFFAACPNCRVDYIAVHCYMNTVSALQWYTGLFKKYGKPIWLTEFAGWESNGNINNRNDQINFMIGAVDFLEYEPSIFRYSWFIGRTNSGYYTYPYIDLLGSNGQLTELGNIYKLMPIHDPDQIVLLPGIIEAEAYNQMYGILIEKTADQSGFANVGYINAGDWLEYKINVNQAENFDIKFRIASTKNSILNLLVDGTNALTQNISNTGGWQNWFTFTNKLNLSEGIHTIRIQAVTDGFNINWIQIGNVPLSLNDLQKSNIDFDVFPNPGNGIFNIKSSETVENLRISDLSGKQVVLIKCTNTINLESLQKGIYILEALSAGDNIIGTKRILIE